MSGGAVLVDREAAGFVQRHPAARGDDLPASGAIFAVPAREALVSPHLARILAPRVAEVAWRRIVETAGTHTPPRPANPSPTWWLRSENEVVSFTGRNDEQAA